MEDQGEVIEAHHVMKPAGQVMEERAQIPVRDNRFRNRQQRSVLLVGGKRLCVYWSACHYENRCQVAIPEQFAVGGDALTLGCKPQAAVGLLFARNSDVSDGVFHGVIP
jgi:hypothetical protein